MPDSPNGPFKAGRKVATPAEMTAVGLADVSSAIPVVSPESRLAGEVKHLVAQGAMAEARERFGLIVAHQQRRAIRIAYHFLRDAADADEAVQEAFLKVFLHIGSFQEDLPFDTWFTRILINGCLDRRKARRRRERWLLPAQNTTGDDQGRVEAVASAAASPEAMLLLSERRAQVAQAIERLPNRQRTVLLLSLYDERSPREVSEITGMNQSTVRVHLFRAVRKMRAMLEGSRETR
ncbi:MAG: RNA polymerase sigma factor [Bacteroidales bacterium]